MSFNGSFQGRDGAIEFYQDERSKGVRMYRVRYQCGPGFVVHDLPIDKGQMRVPQGGTQERLVFTDTLLFSENIGASGGVFAARTVQVKITAQLASGRWVEAASGVLEGQIHNPPPGKCDLEVSSALGGANIYITPPQDSTDLQGYVVEVSTTSNFAEDTVTTYDVNTNLANVSFADFNTRWCRTAAYDSFGKTGLVWSDVKTVAAKKVLDLSDLEDVNQQISEVDQKLTQARQDLDAADSEARSLIQTANDHAASELAQARVEIASQVQNARDAASQADTLLNDAISGKASVVDFNLIKNEVTGARGTQTTLAARLTATDNTVEGKASITALDALTGRVSSTETTTTAHNTRLNKVETDISGKASAQSLSDLQARVSGAESQNTAQNTRLDTVETDVSGKASASSVALLEAKNASIPNLLPNGDFTVGTGGLQGWSSNVGGVTGLIAYDHKSLGRILHINDQCQWAESAPIPFEAGDRLSFSLQGDGGGGDGSCYVQFLPSYTSSQLLPLASSSWESRKNVNGGAVAPPGTTAFRFIVARGSATSVHVARIKINYGGTATNWSDEATQALSQARLSTVERVTTDGTFASATRVSELEATTQTGPNRNSLLSSRLSTVETATTDGRFATANRVSSLELQARAFPNLVKNSDFASGFRFWSNEGNRWITGTNSAWGSVAVCQNSHANDSYLISDPIYVYHSNNYTLSYYADGGNGHLDQSNAVYLACFDGNNTLIADGLAYARADVRDFSVRRVASALIPAGTAYVKVVIRQAKSGSAMHVTRIMLNVGDVAQSWNDTATVIDTAARIRSVETITSDGTFAAATRANTLEAQLAGNQASNLLSRLQTVETATTDGRFSTASRVSQLEVRNNQAINKNADFAVTPVAGQAPQGWVDWSSGLSFVPTSGQVSANAIRWTVAAASDKGIRQDISDLSPGWYVLEATVTLDSGSLRGAGVLLQIADSSGNEVGHDNISFKVEPDTARVVNGDGVAGRTYRFTKIVDARDSRTRGARLYAMAGWTGFDAQTAAKTITFHETRLRRANAAEIETGLVRDNGGLAARLLATETATTDGRFSSATRTNTLEAQLAGNQPSNLSGRITNLETATTDGRFATATRVNELRAVVTTRANICPNGGFENGLAGITGPSSMALANNAWGPHAICTNPGTGTHVINFPKFDVFPGNAYTVSGDTIVFGASNLSAYLDLIFFDASGTVVQDGPEKAIYGQHDFSNSLDRVQEHAVAVVAVATARYAQARAVFSGTGITACGVRRVKVEMGNLPATLYSPEASSVQTNARLSTIETATTDGRFASAQRASTLEAQLRGDQASSLLGRIQNVETATSDGRFATATRVTALEARTNSPNMLPKAVFKRGEAWAPFATYSNANNYAFARWDGPDYSLNEWNEVSIYAYQGDEQQGTVHDFNMHVSDPSSRIQVEAGKRYCVSAYNGAHRADCQVYGEFCDANGNGLGVYTSDYTNGVLTAFNTAGGPSGGKRLADFKRIWAFGVAPANAKYIILVLRKHSTKGGQGNSYGFWTRPMVSEARDTDTLPPAWADASLSAAVNQVMRAEVDLRGRVQSTAGMTVQAGNRVAGMKFHAQDGTDVNYSSIDFLSDTFRIWNASESVGTPPFELRNGGVRMKSAFVDRLSVGTSMTLGSGVQWKVAVQPLDISVTDGQVVNFGYDLGNNPSLTFGTNGLVPLNSGETYRLYADDLSPTGFIARLKIETPASPTNVNTGLLNANANGPTSHHIYIDGHGGRTTVGGYQVRVTGNNRTYTLGQPNWNPGGPIYYPDDPSATTDGSTIITVYGWNGGAWVELDTIYIDAYQNSGNGFFDQWFDQTQFVSVGGNISHIGVAVTAKTYPESYISQMGVNWQTSGSGGGIRSATPQGQLSTVTVRPRA